MRMLSRIAGWFGTGLVALLVLLAAFMVVAPRFGWNTHPVLSGSMEPTLPVGSVVLTMPARPDEIQVGDVITYQSGEQRVTHRVVEIVAKDGNLAFRTKGDANNTADANLVSPKGALGAKAVLCVPYLGYLPSFFQNRQLFLVLVGIPAAGLLALFARELRRGVSELKAKKDSECAERGA